MIRYESQLKIQRKLGDKIDVNLCFSQQIPFNHIGGMTNKLEGQLFFMEKNKKYKKLRNAYWSALDMNIYHVEVSKQYFTTKIITFIMFLVSFKMFTTYFHGIIFKQ